MEEPIVTQILEVKEQYDSIASNGVEDKEKQIRQIKINIFVISIVWMFAFTGFTGLQDIESSLNEELGTYALGALAAGTCIVCLVSPAIISCLGCKESFVVSWICLCLFIGANYYPKDYLLIPAAFIAGIAIGLTWTAQGIYVTTNAAHFAALTGKNMETVLSTFFGVFFMAYQSTQVWGNLISSAVLQYSDDENTRYSLNTSNLTSLECGALNCPSMILLTNWPTGSGGPDIILRYILLSAYMAFVLTGLVVTLLFLKPIKIRATTSSSRTFDLLTSTVRLLFTDLHMMLLVPLFLYTGLEQTVMFAEFTKIYVTCAIGIGWVGYTALCYGVSDTIISPVVGYLRNYLRCSVMLMWALLLNIVALVVMLLWKPSASDKYMFFFIPAIWGLADGVWQTQSSALTGSIFHHNQDAAFANLRLFVSLGKTTAYLYSAILCENIKLYIAGAILIVAVILNTVVEIREQHRTAVKYSNIDD